MNIKLSQKHGVNPSVMVCPVCGKDTGVALLGRLPEDKEAPRRIPDQSPCESCRSEIEGHKKIGFVVFVISAEFEQHRGKASPWQFFVRYSVVKNEAAVKIFGQENVAAGACFVSDECAAKIGL